MPSKKNLFLVILFLFLLIKGIFAAPKRSWNDKLKDRPSLPVIENREEEIREVSSEEKLANEEDDVSVKRRRSETASSIAENSSQETQSSSLDVPTISVAINNLLWKENVPTLFRLALHRIIKLPQDHFVFREGLPPQLSTEFIEPYYNRMQQVIQELDNTCQHYDLYRLYEEKKKKDYFITLKQGVENSLTEYMDYISEENYSKALLWIETMSVQLPYIKIAEDSIKEGKNIYQKFTLAERSGNLERAMCLASSFQAIKEKIKIAMLIGTGRKELVKLLLSEKEPSPLKIESSHQILIDHENKLVQITSLANCNEQLLEQLEELTPEKKEEVKFFLSLSFSIFSEKLDQAFPEGDEEGLQLLNKKRNACDQIMKVITSKEPQIQGIQKEIIETNKEIIALFSTILETKARQYRLTQTREGRWTTNKNGTIQAQGEDYAPIFDLYQFPNDFLNRQISLLQTAKKDLLAGRREMSNCRVILAQEWKTLEVETSGFINNLSQIGLKRTRDYFLNPNQTFKKEMLEDQENQLGDETVSVPPDPAMVSLPWNFEKTFEENIEVLSQKEA